MLAYAIITNKSQEQSFDCDRMYVDKPLFYHGQLHFALSKCQSKYRIKIQCTGCVRNGVWRDA